jgi:hypothetical protein
VVTDVPNREGIRSDDRGVGVAGLIPSIPKSKGLTGTDPGPIPGDGGSGRSVHLNDLAASISSISRLSKNVSSRTVPDMGIDPQRVTRFRKQFGDGRYAWMWRESLTEMGQGNGAIADRRFQVSGFRQARRRDALVASCDRVSNTNAEILSAQKKCAQDDIRETGR